MSDPLTSEQANAIYDVLVAECGAHEGGRSHFVYGETVEFVPEWRFIGSLGFGGKFWRAFGRGFNGVRSEWVERWYVNCYPEDETPERKAAIDRTNVLLENLRAKS